MIKQLENSVVKSLRPDPLEVHAFIREYKQTRWVANSDRLGKPDALSAWFSIAELENFLSEAKAHGADGIKFNYGAYPQDYTKQPEYAGRQTLVSIATKTKITESGSIANKDIYVTRNGVAKILSGLNPVLCPPNCGKNSEGGMGDLGITIVDRGDKGMEIV